MDPAWLGPIEMGMTFGAVAVFTGWQLWTLRDRKNDGPGDGDGEDKPADRANASALAGHPPGQHPLDDAGAEPIQVE